MGEALLPDHYGVKKGIVTSHRGTKREKVAELSPFREHKNGKKENAQDKTGTLRNPGKRREVFPWH